MSEHHRHNFESRDSLMQRAADHIAHSLQAAIDRRGVALLAVSGGSTPKALFPLLAAADIEWQHVKVCLVDERWVEPDDDASNERLVRELLLVDKAAAATFVPMKNASATPGEGVTQRHADYEALPWPADIMQLGMGEDAHTASLFPEADELQHGLTTPRRLVAVTPPVAPHRRMSLSLSAIVDSREILLITTGESKLPVLQAALAGDDVREMPIRGPLQATAPVHIYYSP